jgi:hypothetical protein
MASPFFLFYPGLVHQNSERISEEKNNGYVVFTWNIHSTAGREESLLRPSPPPFSNRLLDRFLKTMWTFFLHVWYLLHDQRAMAEESGFRYWHLSLIAENERRNRIRQCLMLDITLYCQSLSPEAEFFPKISAHFSLIHAEVWNRCKALFIYHVVFPPGTTYVICTRQCIYTVQYMYVFISWKFWFNKGRFVAFFKCLLAYLSLEMCRQLLAYRSSFYSAGINTFSIYITSIRIFPRANSS